MTWNWRDVPATGSDASRFTLPKTPAGVCQDEVDTLCLAANQLVGELIASAPVIEPETRTIALKRAAVTSDGEHVLVDRGSVTGVVSRQPVRPGRFVKKEMQAGLLIDSLLLGESGYADYRDDLVWDALRDLCQRVNASAHQARRLSDEVARALLLRAGIEPPAQHQLPN